MIVVIQCASSKRPDAGRLRTTSNKPVLFVAQPDAAPEHSEVAYARPDDMSDSQRSWREVLRRYNDADRGNPLGLYRAYELYANPAYRRLVDRFGEDRVFILSAGWGLLASNFLTPDYDITFSNSAEPFKRRRRTDRYDDFVMLPQTINDDVVFFGGKDYLPFFCDLTGNHKSRRIVVYNSGKPPVAPGCATIRYRTTTRTNWHYQAVMAFLDGHFRLTDDMSERLE